MPRPYILLSCAVSLDGRIDGTGAGRLVLSDTVDLDRVDEERAGSDAILVGAGTVRRDDPRLLVKAAERRARRAAAGLPESPLRVVVSGRGELDPSLRLFSGGGDAPLVYAGSPALAGLRRRLGDRALVVDGGEPLDLARVLDDLGGRGVRRLMVEGGGSVHTQLLAAGLADELQLAVAPLLVGEGPRFFGEAAGLDGGRLTLAEARPVGDVVLLRYLLTERARDRHWLLAAIALSRRCPPSETAYSVGAVIVDAGGAPIAEGWSREVDDRVHAEESALAKLAPDDPRLAGATIFSSLEPCARRRSRPATCARLILRAGIRRVVFAMREPSLFVEGRGAEELAAAGVAVVEVPELAEHVRAANAHLLSS